MLLYQSIECSVYIQDQFKYHIPVASMSFVPFSFSVLYHNRQTHDNCTCQGNGLIDKFDGAEFHISDSL